MTFFQNFFVKSYRWLAIFILSAVLLAAGSYFAMVLVYGVNKSWAAPVILSKSSPRIVAMSAEAFRAQQAVDTLGVHLDNNSKARSNLVAQKNWMTDLIGRYEQSLQTQKRGDVSLNGKLSRLATDKRSVDVKTAQVVKSNQALAESIDKELKAGLITADAAARSRAQIVSAEVALNSGRIGTAALESQVAELAEGIRTIDGGASSPKALENLARLNTLKRELSDVELKLSQLDSEFAVKSREHKELVSFLGKLTKSPYYAAAQSTKTVHQFAFVPYENESSAKVGSPVYSCFMEVLFCSKVGAIKAVTDDEERGRHPVYQRDIRGFLVDLELSDVAAAKDHVLFFGSRPLFL